MTSHSTIQSTIRQIASKLTQIDNTCVTQTCPVAINTCTLILNAEGQSTIRNGCYDAVLITSCLECIATTLNTPDNIAQSYLLVTIESGDSLVCDVAFQITVLSVNCLVNRNHIVQNSLEISRIAISIENSCIVVAVDVATRTETAIDANLIKTILQASQSLADIEDSLVLTEFCRRHCLLNVGTITEYLTVPTFVALSKAGVDDHRSDFSTCCVTLGNSSSLQRGQEVNLVDYLLA